MKTKNHYASLILLIVLFLIPIFGMLTGYNQIVQFNSSSQGTQKDDSVLEEPVSSAPLIEFDVVDVRPWGLNAYQNYLLASLSGLLNNETARLWIIWDGIHEDWKDFMNESLYKANWLSVSSFEELIEYYVDDVQGLIIFDDLPESANIATPLSGIYSSILVHQDFYSTLIGYSGYNTKPILMNLTLEFTNEGFTAESHRADIYTWAFDRWFSQCNQTALALFNSPNSRHIRSFLCSHSIFTMWQPNLAQLETYPTDDAESQACFNYILNNSPENMIVFGYMYPDGSNEHPVVKALSENGKYLVPSDWLSNLEFYNKLPLPDGYQLRQNRTIEIPKAENKVYVAGIYSDGDNIQYVGGFLFSNIWQSTRRLSDPVPIAYEMSPTLASLAPFMMYYFYNTSTINDYFVPGVGGKGYAKSVYMTQSFFNKYYADTRDLMAACDMREMRSWETPFSEMLDILNNNPQSPTCDGVYEGYGGSNFYSPEIIDGTVICRMLGFGNPIEDELQEIENLKTLSSGPIFVVYHLICWDAPYSAWGEFVDQISADDRVEVVRLDQMTAMIMNIHESQGLASTILFSGLLVLFIGLIWFVFIKHPINTMKNKREGDIAVE